MATFVATTRSDGRVRAASHSPMIVSDSPPLFPGTHAEYTSAVSIALPPPATKRSSTSNEVSRSAVHPNTLPPSTTGNTSSASPSERRGASPVVVVWSFVMFVELLRRCEPGTERHPVGIVPMAVYWRAGMCASATRPWPGDVRGRT